uniref:Uncharacterized protein n=1 Tax=Romanomermis culicivorax TaxID=13658 RepID=A0A915JD25_ROMCU
MVDYVQSRACLRASFQNRHKITKPAKIGRNTPPHPFPSCVRSPQAIITMGIEGGARGVTLSLTAITEQSKRCLIGGTQWDGPSHFSG